MSGAPGMVVGRRRLLGGLATLLFAGVSAPGAAARKARWPGGKAGAVSLTYDDGLASQLDIAMPQLEAAGLRGTFFVTGDAIAPRRADWRAAAARGHELADHTTDHPCNLRAFTPEGFFAREITPMERELDALAGPGRFHGYAYPCDVTDLGPGSANRQAHRYAKLLAQAGIVAARTSEGEPNNPKRVHATRHRLQALAVGYDAPDPAAVAAYLKVPAERGHWAILIFHQIVEKRSGQGDTLAADHAAILRGVAASELWCAPMGQVFAQVTAHRT